MIIGTGKTIYELILSLDTNGNPITGATFDSLMFKDGSEYTGITVNFLLSDPSKGIFTGEWSASTEGYYQFYAKNNITSTIFVSNPVLVKSDNEISTNVYLGF